ncbi:terminase gpA endonuclease subunit [Pirellulaceae bacterium SH449]
MAYDHSDKQREYQRQLMNERRFMARDLRLPGVRSPKRRALCLADPQRYLRTYFDWIFFNPFVSYQNECIDAIAESIEYGTQTSIAAPRGDGKTSICTGMITWGLCRGLISFPVILAAIEDKANQILSNLKKLLTSDKFVEDFPEIGYPLRALGNDSRLAGKQTVSGKLTNVRWTANAIHLPEVDGSPCSGGIIQPLSIDGAIRGALVDGMRPDFGVIDDPETRQSANNPDTVRERLRIIEEDFAGLKGPSGLFGMVALVTIMNKHSLAAKITDRQQKPAWGGIRRGLIREWPTNRHLWENYFELRKACQFEGDKFAWKATQFYIDNFEAMNAGCKMGNPYRFKNKLSPHGNPIEITALQACMNFMCDSESVESFLCEYQNDTRVFDEDTQEPDDILRAKVVESRTNGYEQGKVPDEAIGITCGVDVGKRFCHWTKIAWLGENRGLITDYGVIEVHNYNEASIEKSIKAALADWQEEQANSAAPPDWTFLDTSDGVLTDALYEFIVNCLDFPPIAASKGYGKGQGPKPQSFEPQQQDDILYGNHWWAKQHSQKGVWLYHPDANFWKLWVQERFRTESFDSLGNQNPNTLTLFRPARVRAHTAFAKHIVAEEYRAKKGFREKEFIPVSPNNHWLDATYMACAAAEVHGCISSLQSIHFVQ